MLHTMSFLVFIYQNLRTTPDPKLYTSSLLFHSFSSSCKVICCKVASDICPRHCITSKEWLTGKDYNPTMATRLLGAP
jgi:hypothetical protein